MKDIRGRGIRGILLAAASGTFALCGAAQAQSASPNASSAEAPGAALRAQLTQLAANPGSVTDLVETGRAALRLGDNDAALGFFTRASEAAPQDPRVLAGLASANARTGKPETALLLFAQAASLGAPDGELAGDRGLAYDLLGNTSRAQQDYLLSLRTREDNEIRRRLALSLAISGQREAALRVVEPQVRAGDRAGQRARIMVLALSGDSHAASEAARASLPPQAAQAIAPFLPRLASLSPGDKASAANLGRVPGQGAVRTASLQTAEANPAALAFAGIAPSAAAPHRLPVAPVQDDGPRRRPAGVTQVAAAGTAPSRSARIAASSTTALARSSASAPPGFALPHPGEPMRITNRGSSAASPAAAPSATLTAAVQRSTGTGGPASRLDETPAPIALAALQPRDDMPARSADPEPDPVDGAAANLAVWNNGASAAPAPAQTPVRQQPARVPAASTAAPRSVPIVASPPPAPRRSFSDVASSVSSLNTETPARTPRATITARPAATPPRQSAPRTTAETPAPATTRRAAATTATRPPAATATARTANRAANGPRIWVQLGVSNNRNGFNYEVTRMRRLAPDVFRNQTPQTAQIGSGNHRLLLGPFPTEAAARAVINDLREKNIQSMSWTSPAGTEVTRLTGQ